MTFGRKLLLTKNYEVSKQVHGLSIAEKPVAITAQENYL